jgi:catechol-2,3-dioxygenase
MTNLNLETAHAVLHVRDLEKMVDFYTGMLGFEVTDRGPLRAGADREIVFLSQTARHHHQLALVGGRNEVTGPSENLHHVAYRSHGTLDDLRDLHHRLEDHPEVSGIVPLTHGNAWSVYFADPEGNGIEIFVDTPWHVPQPQGRPLDLSKTNEEIVAWTEESFGADHELSPIEDFYAGRAERLADGAP